MSADLSLLVSNTRRLCVRYIIAVNLTDIKISLYPQICARPSPSSAPRSAPRGGRVSPLATALSQPGRPLFENAAGDIEVSFEFFPPKTEKMEETLWESDQDAGAAAAALRLGDLWRRRLDARAHPRDRGADRSARPRPCRRAPDLRRRHAGTRSTTSRAPIGMPASATSSRCAAIRRRRAARSRRIPTAMPMPPSWSPA